VAHVTSHQIYAPLSPFSRIIGASVEQPGTKYYKLKQQPVNNIKHVVRHYQKIRVMVT
jgi:hypothetical protein